MPPPLLPPPPRARLLQLAVAGAAKKGGEGAAAPGFLFVDILNHYCYFFEQGCALITPPVLQARAPRACTCMHAAAEGLGCRACAAAAAVQRAPPPATPPSSLPLFSPCWSWCPMRWRRKPAGTARRCRWGGTGQQSWRMRCAACLPLLPPVQHASSSGGSGSALAHPACPCPPPRRPSTPTPWPTSGSKRRGAARRLPSTTGCSCEVAGGSPRA